MTNLMPWGKVKTSADMREHQWPASQDEIPA